MKLKSSLLLSFLLILLMSCKGYENVPYFQDLQQQYAIELKKHVADVIKIQTGDKLSIVVSSSATPDLASRYNLPLNASQIGNVTVRNSAQSVMPYIVDTKGNIELPELGKIRVAGMAREEISEAVRKLIVQKAILRDAIVTVEVLNHYIYVLGEVEHPGRISMDKDEMTILEAIAQSGDLTITGLRQNVAVIRNEGGVSKTYFVNLTKADSVFNSPVYKLQPNDYIYVTPNLTKQRQSTPWANTWQNPSIYLTMTSVLLSVAILITNLLR